MAGSRPRERDLFTALGHPLRRRILRAMIGGGERSPRQVSEALGEKLTAVSYHVRMLADCGTIELVRVSGSRGREEHFYRPVLATKWALSALRAERDVPARSRRP